MTKTHRILQSGLDYNSKFSLGPHKNISAPNQLEVAWNTTPLSQKMNYEYFLLFKKKDGEVVQENCLYSVNHVLNKR